MFDAVPSDLSAEPAEPVAPLLAWARSALAPRGIRLGDDPLSTKRRAWSLVLQMPSDAGPVWVKQNARAFGGEAGLLLLLAEVAPDAVLHPLAADPAAARLVLPDGGPVLGEGDGTTASWVRLLERYADLQQRVGAAAVRLRAVGLPDVSPPTLSTWWARSLDRLDAEPAARALVTDAEAAELRGLAGTIDRWAAELDADPLPLSVDHADLHRDNVFDTPDGLRIFDWGDSLLAHPFLSFGQVARTATGHWEGRPTGVDAAELRTAYLGAFLGAFDPSAEPVLDRSLVLAEGLSLVAQAGSWLRMPMLLSAENAGWYVQFLREFRDWAVRRSALDAVRG
jgi:hypothetical protein